VTRARRVAAAIRREAVQVGHSADRPWHAGVDLAGAVDRLLDRADRVERVAS
jgi:hypothetical protein